MIAITSCPVFLLQSPPHVEVLLELQGVGWDGVGGWTGHEEGQHVPVSVFTPLAQCWTPVPIETQHAPDMWVLE